MFMLCYSQICNVSIIFTLVIAYIFVFTIFLKIYQRLSEEASNGVEETQDRCITFLKKFRTYLSKIYNGNADDIEKVSPASSSSH